MNFDTNCCEDLVWGRHGAKLCHEDSMKEPISDVCAAQATSIQLLVLTGIPILRCSDALAARADVIPNTDCRTHFLSNLSG